MNSTNEYFEVISDANDSNLKWSLHLGLTLKTVIEEDREKVVNYWIDLCKTCPILFFSLQFDHKDMLDKFQPYESTKIYKSGLLETCIPPNILTLMPKSLNSLISQLILSLNYKNKNLINSKLLQELKVRFERELKINPEKRKKINQIFDDMGDYVPNKLRTELLGSNAITVKIKKVTYKELISLDKNANDLTCDKILAGLANSIMSKSKEYSTQLLNPLDEKSYIKVNGKVILNIPDKIWDSINSSLNVTIRRMISYGLFDQLTTPDKSGEAICSKKMYGGKTVAKFIWPYSIQDRYGRIITNKESGIARKIVACTDTEKFKKFYKKNNTTTTQQNLIESSKELNTQDKSCSNSFEKILSNYNRNNVSWFTENKNYVKSNLDKINNFSGMDISINNMNRYNSDIIQKIAKITDIFSNTSNNS